MVVDVESVVRYRYRAYPNVPQQRALARLFGSCRVAYNDALGLARARHEAGDTYPGATALQHEVLTVGKTRPERAWMNDVSGVALIQAVRDADVAYRNFFRSLKSEKKRRVGLPRFKSRHDRHQSARFTRAAQFGVSVTGERRAEVRLPKIGLVPFVLSRPLPSDPSSVTVLREPDGRYYLSFVVRVDDEAQAPTGRVCGIDPGLSSFATVVSLDTETGEETVLVEETPKYLRSRARALRRSQRSLSRKKKGSKNRERARERVAVHHRKVREARLDHAHQLANRIVSNHDVVVLEGTAISSMMSSKAAASWADQSIAQFTRLVEEKARRRGVRVVTVDRFFPSTQRCSSCHEVSGPRGLSELSVRDWTCSSCGAHHHRDVNAARNILAEGVRLLSEAEPSPVADGQSETLNECGGGVSAPEMGPPADETLRGWKVRSNDRAA